jgi:hypothetical protein
MSIDDQSPCSGLGERGVALIGVVLVTALLMALAGALALAVRSDTQLRGAFGSGITGFYAAEAGLNKGMGEYRNIFLNYNIPNPATDFNVRTVALGNRNVSYQMTQRLGTAPCDPGCTDPLGSGKCTCTNVVIPAGELFAGLNATQYRYIVNSSAKNALNDVEAAVGAEFLVGNIPLFQFVAFYKNDLEIAPGPAMNLEGRVHTNHDLYLSSNPGALRVRDNPANGVLTVQVSAGNKIYRGRKYQNICDSNSQVFVDKLEDLNPKDNNLDEKEMLCNGGTRRELPASELATWRGSILGNLGNIAIPEPDIIKPPVAVSNGGTATPGVYWLKADLHIILHVGQNDRLAATVGGLDVPFLPYRIEATNKAGADVSARLRDFMRDAAWNNTAGNSSYVGTMPIFVTDVPTANGCTPTTLACNSHLANSYVPPIGTGVFGANNAFPFPNQRTSLGANSFVYTERMGNAAGVFDLDYRRGGFFNRREGKWMLLLNINVRDLVLWNRQQVDTPFFSPSDNSDGGLVIFATIDGPNSNSNSNNYGVRVFGSANLPCPTAAVCGIGQVADPLGVTVASDQAMYVLGNFNQGTVNGGPPRQPASLIGDSINVMSENYWRNQANCNTRYCRDGQSSLLLSDPIQPTARDAVNTWVNAALLGGVDTTVLDGGAQTVYNGGLENYPRFHENWTGITWTYQGSFVSLGTAEHVNGPWLGTGAAYQIYNPPGRAWNYDPAFNNVANLPPLTPRFVYVQQVLFTEDFK